MNIKTIGKFLIAAVLTAVITTGVFAQNRKDGLSGSRQAIEQVRGKVKSANKITTNKKSNYKQSPLSTVNQTNFNLGSDFVIAMLDASQFESDNKARKALIVDLIYLIDSLENQPESAGLQKVLKMVVKETADQTQVRREIENIYKNYANRQTKEAKWYLDAGWTNTNIICGSYVGDNAAIRSHLSEMQKLIKIAPQGTPGEIINSMNELAKYIALTTFTESEYTAIFSQAMNLFETVNA